MYNGVLPYPASQWSSEQWLPPLVEWVDRVISLDWVHGHVYLPLVREVSWLPNSGQWGDIVHWLPPFGKLGDMVTSLDWVDMSEWGLHGYLPSLSKLIDIYFLSFLSESTWLPPLGEWGDMINSLNGVWVDIVSSPGEVCWQWDSIMSN